MTLDPKTERSTASSLNGKVGYVYLVMYAYMSFSTQ